MKTSAIAFSLVLLGSASLAHAGHKLVPADDSSLSSLCVAAAASPLQLSQIAGTHGVSPGEIDTVYCNDIPLKRFVKKYGSYTPSAPQARSSEVAGYLLRKTDTSPLTELCAAAAVSEQEYAKVKEELFKDERVLDAEVLCNGQPLKSFVRKFRNADVKLVSLR